MFRSGYILSRRADVACFLMLPFAAIGLALITQHHLSAIALASVTLLITAPHHFVTWLRTYWISDEWRRWKIRLVVGPAVLLLLIVCGLQWAPVTLALVAILWDHQHSIMQQYGFARIYDFKAGTGGPRTGRSDLWLCWILYLNLGMTSPLFTRFWVTELGRWELMPSADLVRQIQAGSWGITGLFLAAYVFRLGRDLRKGYGVNPVKLVFLAASYFLWYFCSWHTDSILVFGIAHRIMHGVQYIVIVYWYIRRKTAASDETRPTLVGRLVSRGYVVRFLAACLVYAVLFQLISGQPLEWFGFGLVNFTDQFGSNKPRHVYAEAVFSVMALTHFYFDSFIWKVREAQTQDGL
jgi:hypothetical protein